jgi:hypothetical protein
MVHPPQWCGIQQSSNMLLPPLHLPLHPPAPADWWPAAAIERHLCYRHSPCRHRLSCHPPLHWVICSPPLDASSTAVSGPPPLSSLCVDRRLIGRRCPLPPCPIAPRRPLPPLMLCRLPPDCLARCPPPPPLVMLFTAWLPCVVCHLLISHCPPHPLVALSAACLPRVVHRPLSSCHPLPSHPSHTLP